MIAARTTRVAALIGLATSVLWLGGCSSSSSVTAPSGLTRSANGERASSMSVDGIVSAVAGAYNRAVGSQGYGAQSGIGGAEGVDRLAASVVVPAACESAAIKYYDAQGQEQQAYNPATTTRIGMKGPCSTSQGVVTLDVTGDDAQASSSTILINGTAQGTYEGYAVRGVVTNVRMTKKFCGAPASGVIVATLDPLTATVRFDGSLNALATYAWNGMTVSFTIPMQPCS
jgi:hypothetical protein